MKKIYAGKIPFLPIGAMNWDGKKWSASSTPAQVSYDGEGFHTEGDNNYKSVRNSGDWKENKLFFSGLVIRDYYRGRSAAGINGCLVGVTCDDDEYAKYLEGAEVTIFLTDFMQILQGYEFKYGHCYQSIPLAFCKRGQNYGLTLVQLEE
jgi:hypothetical protein